MYTYHLITDDEITGFTIEARHAGKRIGHVDVRLECSANECGFTPYEGTPIFETMLANIEECLCVETIEVDYDHRGIGLASQLMQRAMRRMASDYEGLPCYLNASPMAHCMDLDTLIEFYEKFGFRLLLKYAAHRNALLYIAA